MLQSALDRAGASGSASPSAGTASSAGRSSGQATIDLLQAGLDGKLPPLRGVNPFADLPPVPIPGSGGPPANGVSGAVSFTDAANPFSDLPPVPIAAPTRTWPPRSTVFLGADDHSRIARRRAETCQRAIAIVEGIEWPPHCGSNGHARRGRARGRPAGIDPERSVSRCSAASPIKR
jgi:hypothetical protein